MFWLFEYYGNKKRTYIKKKIVKNNYQNKINLSQTKDCLLLSKSIGRKVYRVLDLTNANFTET